VDSGLYLGSDMNGKYEGGVRRGCLP
jgi:hypothetical protein